MTRRGYAIVEAWDAECATITEVAERFGRVQSHIRADASGIVGISTDTVRQPRMGKLSVGIPRRLLRGILARIRTGPTSRAWCVKATITSACCRRRCLCLQCWQPATSGGASVLIDVQRVFDDLAERDPQLLDILSTNGCVSYCRDDQIALDCAVFEELDDGTIMLRFRYDSTAYVADWARDAFDALQQDYFSDPEYQTRITLKQGQIAIIDNYRMLHGRGFVRGGRAGQEAQHAAGVARARPLARPAAMPPTSTSNGAR